MFYPLVALGVFKTLSHASKQHVRELAASKQPCNNIIKRINRQRLPFIALVKPQGTFTFCIIFFW